MFSRREKKSYFFARSKEATISALARFSVVPTVNFNPFACFEVFVVLEEVGDLRFQQVRQVVHIFDVIVFFCSVWCAVPQTSFRIFNRIRRSFSARQLDGSE
ncbi:Uncharacterised protein [Kluyvera cryocrescens]|uniref:Uncharacterized protein n=1 Tax=Kluyvera cryocrescens TaxID=580 RepID=A0A485BDK2_KLUCR|nr:Uncharacterised protein [Kluyvera cryocrescens]